MKHLSTAMLGVFLTLPAAAPAQTPASVKVTGCLRLWDPSIGALPGEPSSGPRYVLIDARHEDNPGTSVVIVRRYVVTGDPSVNLAGNLDKTVRISGNVTGEVTPLVGTLKLPAPGEIAPRPGTPPPQPGTAARPGEIPPPVSDKPQPDPAWLALSASAVEIVNATCAPPR